MPEPGILQTRDERSISGYVVDWRSRAKMARSEKEKTWTECWELYRGYIDYSDKEDWQSKIVLPKAFSSVKQAVNIVKRLISLSQKPWNISPVNDEDLGAGIRAGQMEQLTRQFLDMANYKREFATGLECGFVTGLGVWKLWWGAEDNIRRGIRTVQSEDGLWDRQLQERVHRSGRLFIRAIDPYNFYWLPGSQLNDWAGTVEDIEIPKWELLKMAEEGIFPLEKVKTLQPMRISEDRKQSRKRFDEVQSPGGGPKDDVSMVKLTEYWGPLMVENEFVDDRAHIVIANDDVVLLAEHNPLWGRKPPYVAFSPLTLPFRTDGVGLVEMTRDIDKGLSQLVNLSVDTLVFRLLPLFEVLPEAFENAEDFETGMHPGKIFRRNEPYAGSPGIVPVRFEDISPGSVQVSSMLDRAHQEGALVSEIQQALPRYRGAQTATETEAKQTNQDSFFGGMAVDIEERALQPIVEIAMELIMQNINTANDPRVAAILGQSSMALATMSRAEVQELIVGDYTVKVTGISEQIEKMRTLENLVQFMNIVGQNQMWMPFINQSAILSKIFAAFRPSVGDVEEILETPEVAAAKQKMMQQQELMPSIVKAMPGMTTAIQKGIDGQKDVE